MSIEKGIQGIVSFFFWFSANDPAESVMEVDAEFLGMVKNI